MQRTDNNMRYISFGNGKKTMVVIPGLSIGYVTDNKKAIEDAFSSFIDDYTVYLFDIREDVPDDYTIYIMGEDLVASILSLGLNHIYLYGCSMGGMQSLYIAGKYPGLVEKLVVVSSTCKATELSNKVINHWIDLAKEEKYHELIDYMGRKIYSKPVYESIKEIFHNMADVLTNDLATRFVNTASIIVDLDITAEASHIKCPVLILGSQGDQVLGVEGSLCISEITGAEIHLYGNETSHAIYDEVPEVRDCAKDFFDK